MKPYKITQDPFFYLIFLTLFAFWFGFFFADPIITKNSILTYLNPIIIGILCLSLILIYITARKSSKLAELVLLVLGGGLAGLLLVFPLASEGYYYFSFKNRAVGFNPFLQLDPPAWIERKAQTEQAIKIAFLGGSTTAWKDSNGVDWPTRVEKKLSANLGLEFQAYNQAKEWYTSRHILSHYVTTVRHHQPQIIVIMEAINDLLLNADFSYLSSGPFRADYAHFNGPINRLVQRKTLTQSLLTKFRTYWYHRERNIVKSTNFPGLVSYEQNLKTLIKYAQTDGSTVVLMTQANLYRKDLSPKELDLMYMLNMEAIGPTQRWSLETALSGMQQYNQLVRRLAREHDLILIDLEHQIAKSTEFFIDDVHYSDRGHALVADLVANQLTAQLK